MAHTHISNSKVETRSKNDKSNVTKKENNKKKTDQN